MSDPWIRHSLGWRISLRWSIGPETHAECPLPSHSRDWSWLVRGSDRCSGVMTASVVFLGARALTLGLVSTTSSRLMMPGS